METEGAAEFRPSSPRATDENSACSICYSAIVAEDVLWQCARCRSPCHLRCTLQWVLRTVMNADAAIEEFTCPVCRTPHAVSSLPGFENTQGRPPRAREAPAPTPAPQSTAALLNLITSIFPEMTSVSAGGAGGPGRPGRQRTITFIPATLTASTTGAAATRTGVRPPPRRRGAMAAEVEVVDDEGEEYEEDDDEDEEDADDDDEEDEEGEYEEVATSICSINTRNVSINIDSLTIHYNSILQESES